MSFNFLPKTFVLPRDYELCKAQMDTDYPSRFWIVKPVASSQGKGIYLTNRSSDIEKHKDAQMIVSHYVSNPLTINGLKFDLRIYVAITSLHPLRIYMYEDGLVRFATEEYTGPASETSNQFVHLTNYSINKTSQRFVENQDDFEVRASKWSMKDLRRVLRD